MDPMEYEKYIVYENKEKALYLVLIKVLYGMLIASLLWHKKFKKDLMSIGFTFSEYGHVWRSENEWIMDKVVPGRTQFYNREKYFKTR
mmetsp:Transcript_22770/g.29183  ORF Transcript_22770/g.29183 Transcript_22770/m.29183 type:complete len:88 (-) Transcript_22770:353-616(-)